MQQRTKNTIRGNIFLLTAALIWGFSLVAQKFGAENMGPFAFSAIRCLMGGIFMIPVIAIYYRRSKDLPPVRTNLKLSFIPGILCGIFLAAINVFQQAGVPYTTAGKAAFIFAMYILIIPLLEVFTGKKPGLKVWISSFTGLLGMYFLCFTSGFEALSAGDIFIFLSALMIALQMITIDRNIEKIEPLLFSCIQFIIAGIVAVPFALIFETIDTQMISACIIPLLYTSLLGCCGGYTLQTVGQKYASASQSALILSLESVFALIAGMIFFHEVLSLTEYIGCFILFAAIIISQAKNV